MRKLWACLLILALLSGTVSAVAVSDEDALFSASLDESVGEATDFGDTGLTLDEELEAVYELGEVPLEDVALPQEGTVYGEDFAVAAASDVGTFTVKDGVLTAWTGDNTIKTLNIPGGLGITAIGEDCFKGQTGLQTVILPGGVKRIEAGAFFKCTGLQQIALNAELISIGGYAFLDCIGLKSITIPGSVTEIGKDAFRGCTALRTATVEGGGLTTIGEGAFCGCTSLQSISLPSSVTTIGISAFEDTSSLVSADLGNGLLHIGNLAFANSGLKAITIPGTLRVMGGTKFDGVFQRCANLESVTIKDGVTTIADSAFEDCAALKRVSIPGSVTEICYHAFYGCQSLNDVSIAGSGLTLIGEDAFRNCKSLPSINLPSSVATIEYAAFYGTSNLTSANLGSGLSTLGDSAFGYSGLKSITVPGTVKTIEGGLWGGTFQNCTQLETVILEDGVTTIAPRAFSVCTKLTSISLPESLTTIKYDAFNGCKALKTIAIPKSVTSISNGVFDNCTALATIYVYENSAAHKYCIDKKLPFALIQEVAVQRIELDKTSLSLAAGASAQLSAKVLPENANDKRVTWTTSNGSVAKVNDGQVTAIGAGTATVTCISLSDVTIKASCTVTVSSSGAVTVTPTIAPTVAPTNVPTIAPTNAPSTTQAPSTTAPATPTATPTPEKVVPKTGSNGTVKVNLGERLQLLPSFAWNGGWTVRAYTSSKAKIASVDGSGMITAKAEGKTKIKITTSNKKKKATITVQVVDPYKPTGISINQGKTVKLSMGQTLQLGASLQPSSARATLTWKSSKPKVATVDGNGRVVPVGEGKAKITVTTHNKKKATITVQVVDPYKPQSVSIAQGKSVTIKVGQTLRLGASLNPSTARSALTWKSSKPAVALVDSNGIVSGVKKGKAKITVTTYNKKKATITVNVVD